MSWHYRAGRVKIGDGWWYTVREFYRHGGDIILSDEAHKLPKLSWTGPIEPGGESKKELIEDLEMMLADVKATNAFTDKTDDKVTDLQPSDQDTKSRKAKAKS